MIEIKSTYTNITWLWLLFFICLKWIFLSGRMYNFSCIKLGVVIVCGVIFDKTIYLLPLSDCCYRKYKSHSTQTLFFITILCIFYCELYESFLSTFENKYYHFLFFTFKKRGKRWQVLMYCNKHRGHYTAVCFSCVATAMFRRVSTLKGHITECRI